MVAALSESTPNPVGVGAHMHAQSDLRQAPNAALDALSATGGGIWRVAAGLGHVTRLGAAFGESRPRAARNANGGGIWRVAAAWGTTLTCLAGSGCELALGSVAHLDAQGRELIPHLI
jgi:hypothetical protein